MKRFKFRSVIFATALITSALAIAMPEAAAQGRNANRYSKSDVGRLINRLEESSNNFRRDFDRAMDESSINGTSQEDRFNRNVQDFATSLDRLRRNFDRQNNWWDTRSDVQDVVRRAEPVNSMMNSIAFRRQLENRWNRMRNDVNALADAYDLSGIGGGGWGGGNPGWGGGNQVAPPNWARGTFYGTSPFDGSRIRLMISDNGEVRAEIGGGMSYGSFTSGNMLYIGGYTSRVYRQGNGLRTVSTVDGQTINYSRTNDTWNDGGWNTGGGWNNPGGGWSGVGQIAPPSWARGTFYGTGPDGSRIILTIANNGGVTANVGGNTSIGGYTRGDVLNIGGNTSRVYRQGNGIRTVSTLDGQTINYSRNDSGWNNNGGWNNPGWNNNDRRSSPPNWARGTFYGTAPDRTGITLTIDSDGRVTADIGGNRNYGTYYNGVITINGNSSRVTETRNGLRTTSTSDGAVINYRRN